MMAPHLLRMPSGGMPDVVHIDDPVGFRIDSPVGQNEFEFACAGSTAMLPGRQNRVREKSDFTRLANVIRGVQSRAEIFHFRFSEIHASHLAILPRRRGAARESSRTLG